MKSLRNFIPPERLDAVEHALTKTFGTTSIKEIELLPGGLSTAKVYKIIIGEDCFVLKLDRPTEESRDRNIAMETAAKAGIGPVVLYANDIEAITITAYTKGSPAEKVFASKEVLVLELAKIIKSIHELPALGKDRDLEATVNHLVAQFKRSSILPDHFSKEAYEYYKLVKEHYPWQDKKKVFSHNDLNPNNIIFDDNRIWIVDWDAAYDNDPYVDLAVVANFYVNSDVEESIFLREYFGKDLSEYKKARFFIMRQICYIVYAMLMFGLADRSMATKVFTASLMENVRLENIKRRLGSGQLNLKSYEGQLLYGQALLNEAVANMRLPRFMSSIHLCKQK